MVTDTDTNADVNVLEFDRQCFCIARYTNLGTVPLQGLGNKLFIVNVFIIAIFMCFLFFGGYAL